MTNVKWRSGKKRLLESFDLKHVIFYCNATFNKHSLYGGPTIRSPVVKNVINLSFFI